MLLSNDYFCDVLLMVFILLSIYMCGNANLSNDDFCGVLRVSRLEIKRMADKMRALKSDSSFASRHQGVILFLAVSCISSDFLAFIVLNILGTNDISSLINGLVAFYTLLMVLAGGFFVKNTATILRQISQITQKMAGTSSTAPVSSLNYLLTHFVFFRFFLPQFCELRLGVVREISDYIVGTPSIGSQLSKH